PTSLLEPHGEKIAELLAERPAREGLLLLAKVKPAQGRPVVKALADDPAWGPLEETSIARAALGDAVLEAKLIAPFLATGDPEEKARLAATVGRIDTPASRKALASELRTPLIVERPSVFRRSVRLD